MEFPARLRCVREFGAHRLDCKAEANWETPFHVKPLFEKFKWVGPLHSLGSVEAITVIPISIFRIAGMNNNFNTIIINNTKI